MEELTNNSFIDTVIRIFTYQFHIGEKVFTPLSILGLFLMFISVFVFAKKMRDFLVNSILPKYGLDESVSYNIGTIFRYSFIVIGSTIVFQSSGLDLSSLQVLIGALGVGIGFGLQTIADNFISGIIILFDQPIKVGDMIEVDEVSGKVVEISARSSTILTNDNITIIVPNSQFISNKVINWSHNEKLVRLKIPIGVSYNEDPKEVRRITLDVVNHIDGILGSPAPDLIFTEWGDNSINFTLNIWTVKYYSRPGTLKSMILYELFERFNKEGISIPFPQRDLNMGTGWDMLKP
ncbi:mechanosensitive ion channel family protein [Flammeovirga kamogawensis]|uniref:Mechanosensitive ion channel n=1 Tax=Flammeovirga kamogawensis TaxID=373891 RepID=A0ABX8GRS4_9BACT|nr:mechanosensitive ion channel domain-containing protein [Flammeovirga kamogawensis]MBB6463195.1 small-conductance mechanosensitive channel [Flammeovirga kamogawensis]QWG05952.1 mechanosensitive ion channel [Flammeovirga kamogawensis]TRX67778.1 mechanosensitive ion channel [Flammeovirga kamogawensis]